LSLTLRDEHILRVFENRMLRGIFGPKRDEMLQLLSSHFARLEATLLYSLFTFKKLLVHP
jgi:hypothetical protein